MESENMNKAGAKHTAGQGVFVAAVSLFLLLPAAMFNWNGTTSRLEKRPLAERPAFRRKSKANKYFFRDCDKYLADRFGLRERLVSLCAQLNRLSEKSFNQRVIRGKDGWLFYADANDGDNLSDFCKENLFTDETLNKTVAVLEDRKEWCEAHGIKFLAVMSPNKHNVYGEYYPFIRRKGMTRADQLMDALKNTDVDIIFPRDLLIASKSKYSVPLYYKTDTHWNGLGAMVSSRPILDKIHGYFPDVHFPSIEYDTSFEQVPGANDIVGMLGINSYGTDYNVTVKPKGCEWSNYYVYEKNEGRGGVETRNSNALLPKAVVYRDSFCSALEPFLSTQFSAVSYRWQHFTQDQKERLLEDKPALVIWQWCERYTGLLQGE